MNILPAIYADNSSRIVVEVESGRVLYEDNIHTRLPMASTTKIMTALVAIESGKLDDEVVISSDMAGVEGSSIYLKVGEDLTIKELLYGLMLRSGNDSATAIAIGVAGSIDAFVDMMNAKAETLGCVHTHFTNPHGLHDAEHYTTAYDLANISRYAMKNSTFRTIVSTKSKIIGGEKSDKRYLVNKNKMLTMYEYATGVKTGFTKKAGRCLVSSAKRGNLEVVSVVLNEPDMWNVSIANMDRALHEYTMVDIAKANTRLDCIKLDNVFYDICTHNDLKYPIRQDEMNTLSYSIVLDEGLHRLNSGEKIGKILVYRDKHLIFEEKIYTM